MEIADYSAIKKYAEVERVAGVLEVGRNTPHTFLTARKWKWVE